MKRIVLFQLVLALVCTLWVAYADFQEVHAEYVTAQRGPK